MPGPDVFDLEVFVESGNGERAAASTSSENDYASVSEARSNSKPTNGDKLGRSKLTEETKALVALAVLLLLALAAGRWVEYEKIQINRMFQKLKADYEALKANGSTSQKGTCTKCDECWEPNGESCYYFSPDALTWEDSRRFCTNSSGDLVKIDSYNKQKFLARRLLDIMSFEEDKFWIGLTDSQQEGQWLWTDGSPLNLSLAFWAPWEPDDWVNERGGEDCARIGDPDIAKELQSWFDRACSIPHRWICEKAAQKG
ncbi:hepatic lectin-like isoform X1 [Corythoichthys intestinalis]|uniref:hepatic lectin-like isoform X1 n=1 Tax=Corythoichthys intestinalis TaxID=161448 RepID=UPI0025A5C472|nr:hepatic lectin-like isoform X1 [Corythoichthys intestinalis]XP_057683618.1 hepatic lectin-like isoform X1 [Corythoichthys intestinalis]